MTRANPSHRTLVRLLQLVLAASMVGGCTATSEQTVLKPLPADFKPGGRLLVDVAAVSNKPTAEAGGGQRRKRIQAQAASAEETTAFALKLVAKLDTSGKFSKVKLRDNPADSGDLLLKCEIADIQRVSEFDRIMIGALGGRARVDVHVTLLELASMQTLGEATVSGASEVGMVIGGTTEDAIGKAAEAVANYVGVQ